MSLDKRCNCSECEPMNSFADTFNANQDSLHKRVETLTQALIRARDQLALYKANYSVSLCNKALESRE